MLSTGPSDVRDTNGSGTAELSAGAALPARADDTFSINSRGPDAADDSSLPCGITWGVVTIRLGPAWPVLMRFGMRRGSDGTLSFFPNTQSYFSYSEKYLRITFLLIVIT